MVSARLPTAGPILLATSLAPMFKRHVGGHDRRDDHEVISAPGLIERTVMAIVPIRKMMSSPARPATGKAREWQLRCGRPS